MADMSDLVAKFTVDRLCIGLWLGVKLLVKHAEEHLTQVHQARVQVLRGQHFLQELLGKWFGFILVVARDSFQNRFIPAPVLEHLRGTFDEVAFHCSTMETRVLDLGTYTMHHVTKLMEECDHFIVTQQRGTILGRFAKVAHHGCDGTLAGSIRELTAGLQREGCGVTVLALTREQIQVEVTQELFVVLLLAGHVVHGVHLHVGMPHVRLLDTFVA
mmetsp:Transcript_3417/g.10606  ORF Transcript_3417/g.10606 Transcript_3417/m.10606 type:complete len:216 (-) Transcript_3417:1083-1730(-)